VITQLPWWVALRGLLLCCLAFVGAAAGPTPLDPTGIHRLSAHVDRVLDGDSIILTDGQHVRLIGINAPETGKDGTPDEPLSRLARSELERLVADKTVMLAVDRQTHDHYGRLLAHIWLADGRNVQQEMLLQGLAVMVAIPPNLAHHDNYRLAEAEARAARRGIWGEPYYRPLAANRLSMRDTGFRFVTGRIYRTWQSRDYIHLALSDRLSLLLPRADLAYFLMRPEKYVGKRIVVRGWVTRYGNSLQIRVRHPAMLDVLG
jgi:micrococcal nuclease